MQKISRPEAQALLEDMMTSVPQMSSVTEGFVEECCPSGDERPYYLGMVMMGSVYAQILSDVIQQNPSLGDSHDLAKAIEMMDHVTQRALNYFVD
jgi:hypothetical protein